jgi:hypothetical protein
VRKQGIVYSFAKGYGPRYYTDLKDYKEHRLVKYLTYYFEDLVRDLSWTLIRSP